MRVALFIAFEPEVGIATLELLEKLGCTGTANFSETARNGASTRAVFNDR